MTAFFKNFPKTDYIFSYTNSKGKSVSESLSLTDISVKFTLSKNAQNSLKIFYPFSLRDHDRPDSLSEKYYGDPNLYWLVMFSGEKFDVFNDLPKDEKIFKEYIYSKYRKKAIKVSDDTGILYPDTIEGVYRYTNNTIKHLKHKNGTILGEFTVPITKTYLELNATNETKFSSVDFKTIQYYINETVGDNGVVVSILEFEEEQNELKRSINLIEDTYAQSISVEYNDKLKSLLNEQK